eukprot:245599-Amphidinium_carterae.1
MLELCSVEETGALANQTPRSGSCTVPNSTTRFLSSERFSGNLECHCYDVRTRIRFELVTCVTLG